MNAWLDAILVGGAIGASLLYAACALGPRSWRRRIAALGAGLATRCALPGLARRLSAGDRRAPGGCGGCDGCAATKPPAH
jgi:Family of unknown function (DUF6587)